MSSSRPSDAELRELLPHTLLNQIAEVRALLQTPRRLGFDDVGKFRASGIAAFKSAIIALAKYGAQTALEIDFLRAVLPAPEDVQFPKLALGLTALLDGVPRSFLRGVDQRYTSSYFDPMALKLSYQFLELLELPEELRPWTKKRWTDGLGYTAEQWLWAQHWLLAPFEHSEDLRAHDFVHSLADSTRTAIAALSDGMQDPYEDALHGELGNDTLAFSREIRGGPPTKETLGREPIAGDGFYYREMISHVHRPIIAKFGRYPYRNRQMGRVSTEEEQDWLRQTGDYGVLDEVSGKLIREDVVNGVWRPLGTYE